MRTLEKTRRLMRLPSLSRKRPRKRPILKGPSTLFRMHGGPVSELRLYSSGTLPFRLGSWHGYYDSMNKWVEL